MTSEPMSVYEAIRMRRDVRAEFTGEQISEEQLTRILEAGHAAPSVGNTQPWDFVVVQKPETLATFAEHVAGCRRDFADSLPEDRRETFDPIKVEGITESGTGIVVTYDPSRGGTHVLGRRTVDDTGVFSAVLAIQNIWLAAVAEGIGVGWVSILDPARVAEILDVPQDWTFIGHLCIGYPEEEADLPALQRQGWERRHPSAGVVIYR